jgi:Uma2 family endonuclease
MTTELELLESGLQVADHTDEELAEEMAGGEHGEIGVILAGHLFNYVYPHQLGRLFDGQTSFDMPDVPKKYRPDIAFVKAGRLPHRVRGLVPLAPDLAIEIVSPTDSLADVSDRAKLYLQAGVTLVWVVNPYDQEVWVYRLDRLKRALIINDKIDGEDVLPGFNLAVKALFE